LGPPTATDALPDNPGEGEDCVKDCSQLNALLSSQRLISILRPAVCVTQKVQQPAEIAQSFFSRLPRRRCEPEIQHLRNARKYSIPDRQKKRRITLSLSTKKPRSEIEFNSMP
jgi:hypothetical protein